MAVAFTAFVEAVFLTNGWEVEAAEMTIGVVRTGRE